MVTVNSLRRRVGLLEARLAELAAKGFYPSELAQPSTSTAEVPSGSGEAPPAPPPEETEPPVDLFVAEAPPEIVAAEAPPIETPGSAETDQQPPVGSSEIPIELAPAASQAVPEPPTAPEPSPGRGGLAGFDWENLIGVKLFSWIAGIALALAAVLLLRYSIDHGWLQPPVQMAIGLAAGLLLIALCEMKIANDFRATANALDGAGIAILYSTLFAAHSIWQLVPPLPSFLLMVAVTALAVFLAIRRDSVFIALLGLLGGFATPALLSTGEDRPIALFGYLLVVNLGIAWVAYRKNWPVLTAASLLFTTLYQWFWVGRFLTTSNLPIAVAVFLVFPAAALIVLGLARRRSGAEATAFDQTATFGAALPLVFGIYAAAVPAYGPGFRTLFGFLFVVAVGLAVLAAARGPATLHLLGGVSTVLAFILWIANSYSPEAWPLIVFVTAAFVAIYLAAQPLSRAAGKPIEAAGARADYSAPLLLFVFPALAAMEEQAAGWILFVVLFALLAAIGFYSARFARGPLFVIGSLFAILTQAIWSFEHLSMSRLDQALIVYCAFGVLMMLVSTPAAGRGWARVPGAWLGLSGFAFLAAASSSGILGITRIQLFIALAVLLAAAAVRAIASRDAVPWLGALLSAQGVILMWETAFREAPFPSIAVLAALGVVAVGAATLFVAVRRSPDSGLDSESTRKIDSFATALVAALFGAQVVLYDAALLDGRPHLTVLAVSHVVVISLLLWLAAWRGWQRLAPVAAVTTGFCLLNVPSSPGFIPQLLLALALFVPFLIYPVVIGRRLDRQFQPHLTAVVASVWFCLDIWLEIDVREWNHLAGLLPLALAAAFGLLLVHLLHFEAPGERYVGRLALTAAAILGYITLAVPLQLDREWVTISWALLAAALAWLYTRLPHSGLVAWSIALGVAVFVRLTFNPAVFSYHPPGNAPVLNWYLYTYGVPALAFFAAGIFFRRASDSSASTWLRRAPGLFFSAAVILLFLLLNIEIADFYSAGSHLTFDFSATLAQDLTYTLGWALFAIALLIAGIILQNRPARIASLALLVAAILKCFLHDLARLGGLYRVGSLVGLALSLALVAVLLQRFVLRSRSRPAQNAEPSQS